MLVMLNVSAVVVESWKGCHKVAMAMLQGCQRDGWQCSGNVNKCMAYKGLWLRLPQGCQIENF